MFAPAIESYHSALPPRFGVVLPGPVSEVAPQHEGSELGALDWACFSIGRAFTGGFLDKASSVWAGRVILLLVLVEVWRNRR